MKDPGRKVFHFAGGIGLLSLYFLLGKSTALLLYASIFSCVLLMEIARFSSPAFNAAVISRFQGLIRANESRRPTGILFYVAGVAVAADFFSAANAAAAVCFLAAGDVAATTVGERYGRTRIGNKSLEGSLAFVIAALCMGVVLSALGIGPSMRIAACGAIAAMTVELLPLRINDNFTIPVLSGAVMELATSLLP